jgi:hypothetical protein
VGIERRKPVIFEAADGAAVASISVTTALFHIPLPFFALHQARDSSVSFRTRCSPPVEDEIRHALVSVFGKIQLRIEQVPWEAAWSGKAIQYTRDTESAP